VKDGTAYDTGNVEKTNNEGESKTDRERKQDIQERRWLDGTTDDKCKEN
jgi:hypothetical protein